MKNRIHESAPVDDQFWGIVVGLLIGLLVDYLFRFQTDGVFTFIGVTAGSFGTLNFILPKKKSKR
ncbi:hypothetical protein [Lentilactobacillus sp. Marseille-Q4993]|uniref:hypothetical protein n=1 Tax=Lentilactobacillus sp. Marseille-Q4993 TaxID=3039492 RepID=UPI0024BBF8D4|nr:hypothetical protein [Lentilactobacillus sp. Marseille-Q4993]